MKTLVFVCGQLCSGKSTYCEYLKMIADKTKVAHLAVSSVVKDITGLLARDALQTTKVLDLAIAVEVAKRVEQLFETNDTVLVDGPRQFSIIDRVMWLLRSKSTIQTKIVWLDVDKEELSKRYLKLQSTTDGLKYNISFEEALQRDDDLGLAELRQKLTEMPWKTITVCVPNTDRS